MWPFSSNHENVPRERGTVPSNEPALKHGTTIPQPITTPPETGIALAPGERINWDYEPSDDTDVLDPAHAVAPHRLGLPAAVRIPLISSVSLLAGFGIGSAVGGTNAGLRYRAENAHHTPTSSTGWYLYNKSKNYHVMLGGVTEGVKNGMRYAGWTALFLGIEEGLDRARGKLFAGRVEREQGTLAAGQRDWLNTLSAAVALSGIYGWWHGFDQFTMARMTRRAVRFAVPFGLCQDLLASLRGDGPWYVQLVTRRGLEDRDAEVRQAI